MGHLVSHCSGQGCVSRSVREQPYKALDIASATALSLSDLPPEILLYHILPHITYLDLYSLSQVNRAFRSLIDTNDHLWERAIENEMLVDSGPTANEDKPQVSKPLPTFVRAKAKFQYLNELRRQQSWITASAQYGCGSKCTFCETLFHKYITIQSSIKTIRPIEPNHQIYVYFAHGEPQNNLHHAMLDVQSQLLVAGPVEYFSVYPSQSRCLKCKSKCHFPLGAPWQPHPYNWFVSYLPKKTRSERIDVLEVYCPTCERFSLWKRNTRGTNGAFKPPKP